MTYVGDMVILPKSAAVRTVNILACRRNDSSAAVNRGAAEKRKNLTG